MDRSDLDPLAGILLSGYLSTASFRRLFADEHGSPPNLHCQVQYLRSVVQAQLQHHDRYHLHPRYTEFGKVEVSDPVVDDVLLLRSARAVEIEQLQQPSLFDASDFVVSDVTLLAYRFDRLGMELATAPGVQKAGRGRVLAAEPPEIIGVWGFDEVPGVPAFAEEDDAFDDLERLDMDEPGDGQG